MRRKKRKRQHIYILSARGDGYRSLSYVVGCRIDCDELGRGYVACQYEERKARDCSFVILRLFGLLKPVQVDYSCLCLGKKHVPRVQY